MVKKIDFKEAYKEQKSKGIDIMDPMKNLITEPEEEPKKSEELHSVERRTKRVQIVMTQSLYEQVKREADKAGISFNELINQLCMKITQ